MGKFGPSNLWQRYLAKIELGSWAIIGISLVLAWGLPFTLLGSYANACCRFD